MFLKGSFHLLCVGIIACTTTLVELFPLAFSMSLVMLDGEKCCVRFVSVCLVDFLKIFFEGIKSSLCSFHSA